MTPPGASPIVRGLPRWIDGRSRRPRGGRRVPPRHLRRLPRLGRRSELSGEPRLSGPRSGRSGGCSPPSTWGTGSPSPGSPMAWTGRSGGCTLWATRRRASRCTSPPLSRSSRWRAGSCAWRSRGTRSTRCGPAALGAALLFAVHPLRVEPVAWLSARGDLVAGLAAFLTVLAYLRGTRAGYWTSVVLFAVALTGKSMLVTLPLVLLVLDVYPLRRLGPFAGSGPSVGGWWNPPARRIYLEKAPFLAPVRRGHQSWRSSRGSSSEASSRSTR